ncbi:NAD-dependent epimerase/dehydratase family protein [Bacillus sp. V59.32b]|uniref:NAD-dependent epimerase/dehydratase family protein n=1 Tax=Bacillus sp. V59.32b TaxID=1758642 RepID=UPI000E3E440C|nr:NAD-dependent epimerase/dehydratase family protein [Bacillus sp. V59.32b]RFU61188.1 NAD-dependent epimerase/dehydratase family protein [Bacillus sp. V59.32b]
MKVLVLGGTRFFGKRLVESLIEKGADVTIGTRGKTADPFGIHVNRLELDRFNRDSLKAAAGSDEWDIVYDQIGYSPGDAKNACEVFKDRVGHYVFTSSQSVYKMSETILDEADFNPYSYPVSTGDRNQFTYDEGKRLAEAFFYQKSPFPVTAVRFPIVLGVDDYTERLLFHVRKVKEGQEIGLSNCKSSISFISSEEAAAFLAFAGENPFNSPVNACSNGSIELKELMALIEEKTGNTAIVTENITEDNESPYNLPTSWVIANDQAKKAGFQFKELKDWLPVLIAELAS